VDDLDYARERVADLGPAFCLTFVKGVDEREALTRMGACPGTIAVREPGTHAAAVRLGAWTLVVEPGGAGGADHVLLEAVSQGTEALSVLRDERATPRFTYARDARTAVAFDPAYPASELIWGTEPDLLSRLMYALDLREPAGENDETWRDAEAKALVLAQRLTNARVPVDALTVPRLSARLEPWFIGGVRPGDLVRLRTPVARSPAEKREIAARLLEQMAGKLDIGRLDVQAGRPITMDSDLGHRVREGLADPATYGAFTTALRGFLDPDPEVALRAVLRALDQAERAAVLAALS
jgi:hypothetical protein